MIGFLNAREGLKLRSGAVSPVTTAMCTLHAHTYIYIYIYIWRSWRSWRSFDCFGAPWAGLDRPGVLKT